MPNFHLWFLDTRFFMDKQGGAPFCTTSLIWLSDELILYSDMNSTFHNSQITAANLFWNFTNAFRNVFDIYRIKCFHSILIWQIQTHQYF